jgi:hypothetical protein
MFGLLDIVLGMLLGVFSEPCDLPYSQDFKFKRK